MLHSSGLAASAVMQAATPAAPVTGGTVLVVNTAMNGLTVVNPAGTLATLTVSLPADAASTIGQIERIAFRQIITSLTVNVAGGGTVSGAPATAQINDNIGFQKIATNIWSRLV